MEFEIKKGVAIPPTPHGAHRIGGGRWQKLREKMEVGDCVDVPEKAYNSMYVAASRLGINLKSRRGADGLPLKYVRIWRL